MVTVNIRNREKKPYLSLHANLVQLRMICKHQSVDKRLDPSCISPCPSQLHRDTTKKQQNIFRKWFTVRRAPSSYGCTREVGRARTKKQAQEFLEAIDETKSRFGSVLLTSQVFYVTIDLFRKCRILHANEAR